jgi:hypothetical protein
MKTKPDSTVYFVTLTWCLPVGSRHFYNAEIPSAMLDVKFANMEHCVLLYFQVEGNKFQRLLQSNYLHIYQGMHLPSFVFIGK